MSGSQMDPKIVEDVSGQLSEGTIINRIAKVNPSHRTRQGAAPDDASMVSAFGSSDEARHIWEPTWHACLQRLQGTKTSNQAIKHSPLQRHKDSPLPNFAGHNVSLLSQQNNTGPHITDAMISTTVKESSPLLDSASRKRKAGDPTVENEVPDIESKLASAALAISAATSAAEVAALAAKIASNAAVQVKLMADKVFSKNENARSSQNDGITLLGGIMSSNIIAAKEASRRRVEAASAALKHAENLNEIVKAAELTADAANQARKILVFLDHDFVSNNVNRDLSTLNTVEQPNVGPSNTEMHTEISRVSKDDLTKGLLC